MGNIWKDVKAPLIVIGVLITLFFGYFLITNLHDYHNKVYSIEGSIYISKVDGPFSRTRFYRDKSGSVAVSKTWDLHICDGLDWSRSVEYYDQDGDGKVDTISYNSMDSSMNEPDWRSLERKEHFSKYRERFIEGDRILKKEKKRFSKYL